MIRNSAHRLRWMAFGLTVCLMAPACRTNRVAEAAVGESPASSAAASATLRRLNEIVIPEMTFFAPATIIDAIDFLKKASRDYDKSGDPPEKRGLCFVLCQPPASREVGQEATDPFGEGATTNGVAPMLPAISVRAVSLMDALKLVCEVTGMRFSVTQKGTVHILPKRSYLEEGRLVRTYNIPYALYDRLHNPNDQAAYEDANKVWQAFFDQLGVTGPDFAEFEYMPDIGKLRVTNTPENLAVIESFFESFALRLVEVEVQIHAFRVEDIERLRLSGGVSLERLMALRREGKSRPVATSTALTMSGQEATVKGVREVPYPAELTVGVDEAGSNNTSRSAAVALMPGNFGMRETGMILQVLPEAAQGGSMVSLILNPQWITLEGGESYQASLGAAWAHKTLAFRQPVFCVTSFQTQVSVEDGATVSLGSCSTPDGEWVQAGFLSVRLRDAQQKLLGRGIVKTKRDRRCMFFVENNTEDDDLVMQKMRAIIIPEMAFPPSATIIDALKFFKEASVTYDKSEVPGKQHAFDFILNLLPLTSDSLSAIPALNARFIDLYDAMKLVCDGTGMKFRIRDHIIWIEPTRDTEGQLLTRAYRVLPSMTEACVLRSDEAAVDGHCDMNKAWKSFFTKLGIKWPEGSSITYSSLVSGLRVTNTGENLDVLEQILSDTDCRPRLVEVDVQIHAFPSEDIELLRLSGDVSVESLMALRQKGRAKQVASASVLTKTGQESVMKSVRELVFSEEMAGSQADSSNSERGGVLMPSKFEMREVGMILQVVPEIDASDRSLINLILSPQWVTLDRWDSYPSAVAAGWTHKTLPFRQPVFGVTSFQTQVTMADGGTVLLGSSSTPDGKWVNVGFLTARRVNVQSGVSESKP